MKDQFLEMRKVVLLRHDEEGAEDGRSVLNGCVESVGVYVLEEGEGDGVGFWEQERKGTRGQTPMRAPGERKRDGTNLGDGSESFSLVLGGGTELQSWIEEEQERSSTRAKRRDRCTFSSRPRTKAIAPPGPVESIEVDARPRISFLSEGRVLRSAKEKTDGNRDASSDEPKSVAASSSNSLKLIFALWS